MAAEIYNLDSERHSIKSSLKSDDLHVSEPTGHSVLPLFEEDDDEELYEEEEDLGEPVSENEDSEGPLKKKLVRKQPPSQSDEDLRRIGNITDENPHLMAYLDDSESEHSQAIASSSDDDDDDDIDDDGDSSIEAEEELAIRAELKERPQNIPGPLTIRRLSQSQQARNAKGEDSDDSVNEDDDDDAQSETSSWGHEFLEDQFDFPGQSSHSNGDYSRDFASGDFASGGFVSEDFGGFRSLGGADEDDTYLWQYFVSSDDEDKMFGGQQTRSARARLRRLSRSQEKDDGNSGNTPGSGSSDEELPIRGRGPLRPNLIETGYVPSGDSTDEDDGVPPERKRRKARGTKAIEVLGSDSFSARPPVLGSWRIKGDKNVGIIDGLTTRTLSPPPTTSQTSHTSERSPFEIKDPFEGMDELGDFTDFGNDQRQSDTPVRGNKGGGDDAQYPHQQHDEEDMSDLDLLELHDFINTEGISSDENENQEFEFDLDTNGDISQQQQEQKQFRSTMVSPYLYRNRLNNSNNVPISAFRNRGSPYVSNPAYPSENVSPAPWRRRGSLNSRRPYSRELARDQTHSPGMVNRKRNKKRSGSQRSSSLAGGYYPEHGHDLFGELIDIGAISPFEEEQ